jgi:cytochrome c-type biogenesis protein CcmH
MMKRPMVAAALTLALTLVAAPALADDLSDLKDQLICQCGCNLVLASCQDMMECGPAQQMTDELASRLAAGETPAQITASLVARYGKAVLAAPPKAGFDLTAWITPFVALIAGLIVLYFIVHQLARQGQQHRDEAVDSEPGPSAEELERFRESLQEDLKDYI